MFFCHRSEGVFLRMEISPSQNFDNCISSDTGKRPEDSDAQRRHDPPDTAGSDKLHV